MTDENPNPNRDRREGRPSRQGGEDDERGIWSVQEVSSLSQRKRREETQCMLVEGRHPIEEALRAGLEMELAFVNKDSSEQSLPDTSWPFEPHPVDQRTMARLADTKSPPPCLAVFRQPAAPSTHLLQEQGLTLVLYEIQDPGNLGALLRSAVAFGVSAVILLGGAAADVYSPKVIRAAAGLLFSLPIYRLELNEFLDQVQTLEQSRIYITSSHEGQTGSSVSARQADYSGNCFIVLGNEGHGVDARLAMHLPQAQGLMIPMDSRVESLNVAICGSILMAEAAAQRQDLRLTERSGA
jgi:TrmH family RNA methyltransferase